MKEFNLEEAKKGAKVCTRDGRPARIICWDAKLTEEPFDHIIALILDMDLEGEEIVSYDDNGRWTTCKKTYVDLMMEE